MRWRDKNNAVIMWAFLPDEGEDRDGRRFFAKLTIQQPMNDLIVDIAAKAISGDLV
jgi:hypothetical protein